MVPPLVCKPVRTFLWPVSVTTNQLRTAAFLTWPVKINYRFGSNECLSAILSPLCLFRTHSQLVEEWVFGIHWIQKSLSTKASLARCSRSIRAVEGLQDVQSVCAHYLCGTVPVFNPSLPMSSSTTLLYPSFSMQSSRTWSTRCNLRSMASRWGLTRMGESVSVWRLSSIRVLSLYSSLTNSWSRKWVDFFTLRQARKNQY